MAFFFFTFAMAQNEKVLHNFLWPYHLPLNIETGPARVTVSGKYWFSKERLGDKYHINLHFENVTIKFEHPYTYRYKGTNYTYMQLNAGDGLATDGFPEIDITSITLQFPPVTGFGITEAKSPNFMITTMGDAYKIAYCEKDSDVGRLQLMLATSVATNMNWSGSGKLNSRIERIFKKNKDKEEYKIVIRDADNAFNGNNMQEAKQLYKKALTLFPNEAYPVAQLAKIEKKLEDQQSKEKQETERERANKINTNNQQTTQNTATTPNNTTTKQNNNNSLNNTENTSGELSERVKVNGEYVQVFKKNGVPYMKRADGSINQTTEVAYTKISQASDEQQKKTQINKQNEVDAQIQNQQRLSETMNEIKAKQEAAKKLENDLVEKTTKVTQSFMLNSQAENSLNAARETSLNNIYNSVEELNADFNRQMQIINQETNNFSQTKTEAMSNYIDATGNYGTSYDGAINSSMKAFAGVFSDIKADKIKKEEQARLRAEREAQIAAIESRRKAAIFGLRKKLFDTFHDGKLPLESSNVKQSEVYIFAYIGSKENLLMEERGSLSVSSIFTVQKSDDGSFPYKSMVASNLKKFGNGNITIVGYYLNESQAKEMQATFVNWATKSNIHVSSFNYISPKKENSNTATTDFWETGNKITPKQEQKTSTAKSSFWND